MTDGRPDSSAAKRALDKFKQLESQVSKMSTSCTADSWSLERQMVCAAHAYHKMSF
jgi:hypothetical protein